MNTSVSYFFLLQTLEEKALEQWTRKNNINRYYLCAFIFLINHTQDCLNYSWVFVFSNSQECEVLEFFIGQFDRIE